MLVKKLFLTVALLTLIVLNGYTQQPKISITLETDHFLFGQTVWATYRVENLSEKSIWIGGKESNGKFYLLEWDAKAFYPDGKEVPQYRGGVMVVGNKPTPKKMLKPGEYIVWSQPIPVTNVSIDRLPAGEYKLIFYLKYSLNDEPGIFEKETQANTNFFVDTPKGEDAAWLKEIEEAKKSLYKKDPTRVSLNQPLIWGDVLDCSFCPPGSEDIRATLLKKYPTSTYAGYELAKCAKENLQDYINMSSEDIDEVLGVRGLIAEKQDAYRKERIKYFEERLKLLQKFIAAHPDFVKADMIRSGISFYLLVLGRENEAIEEMKILSKMEGRWAEGAKKALQKLFPEKENAPTK
jgi:hypothetical protein